MALHITKVLPVCRAACRKFSVCNVSPVRNYWRRNGFSELSTAIQSVENRMREMDREMNRFFEDFQRASPVKLPNLFSVFDGSRTREIPVIATDGNGRVYKVALDMQGMAPEDINITLKDHELTISAKTEETRSDGSRFVREGKYHYTLPKEVNPEHIRSSLIDGVLTIEAPLPALESKEIPIKIEGASKIEGGTSTSESKKD